MTISILTSNTCSECWFFMPKPRQDHFDQEFVGCGNDVEFVASVDPVTHQALTYRPALGSDSACPSYVPEHEDDDQTAEYNATLNAGVSQGPLLNRHRDDLFAQFGKQSADQELSDMAPSPEFVAAMKEARRLAITLGDDHADTMAAMMVAVELAPPEARAMFHMHMSESGNMPEAKGYTDDGEPVFSPESIAAMFDVTVEEVKQAMAEVTALRDSLGLPSILVDPAQVHLKH